jgi:hypothetical protein
MQQNTVSTLTVIVAIWGAIGPLVGIFIGSYLVRSHQRRQWIATERVKEWRELLTALTTSLTTMIKCSKVLRTPESIAEDLSAHVAAGEVLGNRLLIAQEVRRRKIMDRWHEAVKVFEENHDATAFGTNFGNIVFLIEDGARTDVNEV